LSHLWPVLEADEGLLRVDQLNLYRLAYHLLTTAHFGILQRQSVVVRRGQEIQKLVYLEHALCYSHAYIYESLGRFAQINISIISSLVEEF
jgi:hypothetical protein